MNLLLILVCFVVFLFLILWINKLVKRIGVTSSQSKSIITVILIFTLAIIPVYFYHKMSAAFDFVEFYSGNLFGFIPISVFMILLNALWIYLLTCLIFQYIYKITLENAASMSLIFYMPFIIITTILLVIKYMDLHYSVTILSITLSLDWLY